MAKRGGAAVAGGMCYMQDSLLSFSACGGKRWKAVKLIHSQNSCGQNNPCHAQSFAAKC
jgi:hypothetical protein